MAATSYKANVLAAELRENLSRRFTTVSDVLFDSDGAPYVNVSQGTMAAGQQAACIKVIAESPLGVDGLGLTPRSFGPHRVQIVLETSGTANVALMTEINKVYVYEEAGKTGAKVELYMSANGNAVGPEDITTGNLKGSWDLSLKYRQMSNS